MKEAGIELDISWHKSHPLWETLQKLYGAILLKLLFPLPDDYCGKFQVLKLLVTLVTETCKK